MPSIPPAPLPSSEASENPSAPSKPGKYPPAREPIVIPIIIMVFRDIFVAVIVTHLDVDMISSWIRVKGRVDPISNSLNKKYLRASEK
jgi:hypothetical protein